jgi:mRNA interferase MazF
MKIQRGTVVLVNLEPTLGHEQTGVRPSVVVSDPEIAEDQRFPLLCVVPITATPGEGALYPTLTPGSSGLRKPSTALVDQVRSVDKRRISSVFGRIAPEELDAIDEGLILFLGLSLHSA